MTYDEKKLDEVTKGLTTVQVEEVRAMVKEFQDIGVAIPWGLIQATIAEWNHHN